MSNPGVIILAETRTRRGESFRIEDNIGESIHIHYKNIRMDFTVRDFLSLARGCSDSLQKLYNK